MLNKKFVLTISVLLILLLLNGVVFANYLQNRRLFSKLKNECQAGGLLFYNEGVLTCNNTGQVEIFAEDTAIIDENGTNSLDDSSLNTVLWSALTSYPTGCSTGQAVRVIGDTLICFSVWDDISDLPLASPADGDTTHLSTADQIYDWVIGKGYITNDGSIPKNDLSNSGDLSFDWSNDEVADNLTINSSGSITWSALTSYPTGCSAGQAVQVIGDTLTCISVGGSSLWIDGGAITYLASTTDDLVIGGTDNTAPFYFDVGLSLLTLSGLTVNNAAVFNEAGGDFDFRVEGSTEDNLLRIDAGTDEIRMGDWDTNYAKFAKDGELTLTGTARVTKKAWIDAGGMRAPGLKPATFVLKGIAGAWEFSDAASGNEESVSGVWTIPNDMEAGSVITTKLNWFANGVSPGDCEWQLEYLWVKGGEDETGAAQETLTTTSTASSTSNGMVNATFTGIDAPDSDDKGIFFQITRLSASGNDTISAAVWLRGRSILYTSNKLGTSL